MLQGIHLIKHAAWRTLERGAQFVLLGSAPDPRVQASALMYSPSRETSLGPAQSPLTLELQGAAKIVLLPNPIRLGRLFLGEVGTCHMDLCALHQGLRAIIARQDIDSDSPAFEQPGQAV